MKLLKFIKQLWGHRTTPPVNATYKSVPVEPVSVPKAFYEFNEFEVFFVDAIDSARYDSLQKMLDKGFKVNKELRNKLYDLFWTDYSHMTMGDKDIFKHRNFDDNKFQEFITFMVKNHLFEMDFFDVMYENDIHLKKEDRDLYRIFKEGLNVRPSYMENNEKFMQEKIANYEKIYVENKDKSPKISSEAFLKKYSLNQLKSINDNSKVYLENYHALARPPSSNYNIFFTNKKSNIYKMSLSFSQMFEYTGKDGYSLNDGTLSNFNILKNPFLHIPFLNFLKLPELVNLSNIDDLKDICQSYANSFGTMTLTDRDEIFGRTVGRLYHLEVPKKEIITCLFFPFLIKSMIEKKGIAPIDLFNNVMGKGGAISDLAIIIFQNYPTQILNHVDRESGALLVKKLENIIWEYGENKNSLYFSKFHSDDAEEKIICNHLKQDIKKIVDFIYKKDEDNILLRLDMHNAHESEKNGDFVSFAKAKELPIIIVEKLEYISGKLEILKKSELDIENKNFVEGSSEKIFKILNSYFSLEELKEDINEKEIEGILINPLINIDNALEVIFKDYQEYRIRKLSVKNLIAKR